MHGGSLEIMLTAFLITKKRKTVYDAYLLAAFYKCEVDSELKKIMWTL